MTEREKKLAVLSADCAFVLIAETAEFRASRTTDPEARDTLLRIREYAVKGLKRNREGHSEGPTKSEAEIRAMAERVDALVKEATRLHPLYAHVRERLLARAEALHWVLGECENFPELIQVTESGLK